MQLLDLDRKHCLEPLAATIFGGLMVIIFLETNLMVQIS